MSRPGGLDRCIERQIEHEVSLLSPAPYCPRIDSPSFRAALVTLTRYLSETHAHTKHEKALTMSQGTGITMGFQRNSDPASFYRWPLEFGCFLVQLSACQFPALCACLPWPFSILQSSSTSPHLSALLVPRSIASDPRVPTLYPSLMKSYFTLVPSSQAVPTKRPGRRSLILSSCRSTTLFRGAVDPSGPSLHCLVLHSRPTATRIHVSLQDLSPIALVHRPKLSLDSFASIPAFSQFPVSERDPDTREAEKQKPSPKRASGPDIKAFRVPRRFGYGLLCFLPYFDPETPF
ncbi:unnamed protein product [Cyclocybe aegerita]|uniref:Uncharacterized protein n=1 Tax=Cyclocybe aegerita TaxID=1973307 RepID=A0A8S0VXP0_CYCAE|nr:unnamed protein product [Cyclocybe aegerita]